MKTEINWIDCQDRLPEKDGYWDCKLHYIREGYSNRINSAYYYNKRWLENCDDIMSQSFQPTHWAEM